MGEWKVTDPSRPTRTETFTANAAFDQIVYAPDGATLAAVDDKNEVVVWNAADPAQATTLPISHQINTSAPIRKMFLSELTSASPTADIP